MNEEIYFTTHLTETEHNIVHELLKEQCAKRNLELVYYREFKQGHVPMYRECKVRGKIGNIVKMISDIELETDNANRKIVFENEGYIKIQKCYLRDRKGYKCTACCMVGRYKEILPQEPGVEKVRCNRCGAEVKRYE